MAALLFVVLRNIEVNIEGLEDYMVPTPHKICYFSLIENEDKEDGPVKDVGSSEDKEEEGRKVKIQTRSKRDNNCSYKLSQI